MVSNTLPLVFNDSRYELGGITHENIWGLVVFLDALGIKGIWRGNNVEEVLNNWNKVYYMFSDSLENWLSGVNLTTFSDTFIISMRGHEELFENPLQFVEIMCNALIPPFLNSMHYGLFFRGIISMGYFSRSSRMLIGPAVDEAALHYEAAK
jgi:hypothetical protein